MTHACHVGKWQPVSGKSKCGVYLMWQGIYDDKGTRHGILGG